MHRTASTIRDRERATLSRQRDHRADGERAREQRDRARPIRRRNPSGDHVHRRGKHRGLTDAERDASGDEHRERINAAGGVSAVKIDHPKHRAAEHDLAAVRFASAPLAAMNARYPMKNDESTQPLAVSVQPNCACIGIAATEMFVRSMYEMRTAAPQSSTTLYHAGQRRWLRENGARSHRSKSTSES